MSSVITSSIELKSCPFCGGTAHIEVDDIQEPKMFWHYSPRCDDWACLGHMFWFMYNTEKDAAEVWNMRHERTCHNLGGEEGTNFEHYDFGCSACGLASDVCEPNFCPNCGARVVD